MKGNRVEVMHSLHCLNSIRKAISPAYYAKHDKHKFDATIQNMHIGWHFPLVLRE